MKNHKFFDGKIIWITGASSGIGEALAIKLSAYNTRLILSSNQGEELERVKVGLYLKPENIYVLPLDLGDPASLEDKAKEALKAFGRIDVLINNGGVSQRSVVMETSIETDRKIMEINYFSGVILTKNVMPSMLARGSGHIAAVSSITGKFGFPLRSAYSASKHAIYGFYESLGAEYSDQGIRTTIICPGRIKTNISLGALGPDGKPQNVMDRGQQNGISAENCAMDIINGIRKNKRDVYTGGKEILMVYIKRFLPWLAYRQVRKIKRT
jgi:dehydrogenase/reductase SDR family protein 7B